MDDDTPVSPSEQPVYQCPIDAPVQVVGGKWKLVLLFYLLQGPRRNGELRRLVPTITQKMLTQQLRELEADGMVTRTMFDQVPPKVLYAVNPDERAKLEPLLQALCDWGLYWSDKTGARILALEAVERATRPNGSAANTVRGTRGSLVASPAV